MSPMSGAARTSTPSDEHQHLHGRSFYDDGGQAGPTRRWPGRSERGPAADRISGSVVNDDNAETDGYSEGREKRTDDARPQLAENTPAFLTARTRTSTTVGPNRTTTSNGRPQFQPSIAVNPVTGTLGLSWYDARDDPALVRFATYTTTSIDGGTTSHPTLRERLADRHRRDHRHLANLGPIPANASLATRSVGEPYGFGFGSHQGLAMYDGMLYPGLGRQPEQGGTNNNRRPWIYSNIGYYAAGPRDHLGDVGPDRPARRHPQLRRRRRRHPQANDLLVTFDRPINAATFTRRDVVVMYRDTTAGHLTGGPCRSQVSVVPTSVRAVRRTEFLVNFSRRRRGRDVQP